MDQAREQSSQLEFLLAEKSANLGEMFRNLPRTFQEFSPLSFLTDNLVSLEKMIIGNCYTDLFGNFKVNH
jgi:hypothetical protein